MAESRISTPALQPIFWNGCSVFVGLVNPPVLISSATPVLLIDVIELCCSS